MHQQLLRQYYTESTLSEPIKHSKAMHFYSSSQTHASCDSITNKEDDMHTLTQSQCQCPKQSKKPNRHSYATPH